MMILDHLLRIEAMETQSEAEAYATGLYLANGKFAKLCDLAYRRSMITRYPIGKSLPKYKQDTVPYGYNFACLEGIYNKLLATGFTVYGDTRIIADEVAEKKLIQVFESLSDVECRFVQYLLKKSIPWFGREAWKRAKHS